MLASAEPWFDPEQDAWFDLDLEGEPPEPLLRRRSFAVRGTTGGWLTSEAFDLQTDRSLEAESAYLRAMALLTQEDPALADVMDVHEQLVATFPDVDRFWVRWNAFVEERGGEPGFGLRRRRSPSRLIAPFASRDYAHWSGWPRNTEAAIPPKEMPTLWRSALEDLLEGYQRVCAYFALPTAHTTPSRCRG